jgi:TonB family protein
VSPATAVTFSVRWRLSRGPALKRHRLPVGLTLLSALVHGALFGSVMLAAILWPVPKNKVYVVNLVPAVAGVGVPQAKPAPKPPPETKPAPAAKPEPRPEPPPQAKPEPKPAPRPELPPPTARSTPAELPAAPTRNTPAELPQRTASAEMPARQTPRTPAAPAAPDLPAATPTLPRPGDKEMPRLASAPRPEPPAPAPRSAPAAPAPPAPAPRNEPAAAPAPPAPPPAPAPAAGRPSGSAAGSGAVTLEVTDFPYAYYLLAIQNKITERWHGRALDGRQPVATFQIDRTGRVSGLAISKTSGNPYYDQAAMRAILEAAPFPPLPQDFPGSFLRVHLGFNFSPDRG